MKKLTSTKTAAPSVYFVGIGGIGMSALARYFKAQLWNVSGSDITAGTVTRSLKDDGIRVLIGHKKENIKKKLDLVIYNRAIHMDNPELAAAESLGVPVLSYAEALGEVTEMYDTIAISGSHGKSTTSSMAGLMLTECGLDPTVLVGTNLKEFKGKNIRMGKSPFLVLESDDFGGAFTHYMPTIAIVTNIDHEHLDYYGSFANLKKAFLAFLANTQPGGAFVLNRDDKNLFSLKKRIEAIAKKNSIRVDWYSLSSAQANQIKKYLRIPGEHNLSNALAVYALGKLLNIPEEKILPALALYQGAWRRMEYRGIARIAGVSCKTFDDYAHHPTEIKATLQAFREKFPDSPLVCVFQPHQAKRLASLFNEFKKAFTDADATLVLPLYKVPGRDEIQSCDSESLVRAIQKSFPTKRIFYLGEPKKLKLALTTLLSPADKKRPPVIVMMGAGNIVAMTGNLLARK